MTKKRTCINKTATCQVSDFLDDFVSAGTFLSRIIMNFIIFWKIWKCLNMRKMHNGILRRLMTSQWPRTYHESSYVCLRRYHGDTGLGHGHWLATNDVTLLILIREIRHRLYTIIVHFAYTQIFCSFLQGIGTFFSKGTTLSTTKIKMMGEWKASAINKMRKIQFLLYKKYIRDGFFLELQHFPSIYYCLPPTQSMRIQKEHFRRNYLVANPRI